MVPKIKSLWKIFSKTEIHKKSKILFGTNEICFCLKLAKIADCKLKCGNFMIFSITQILGEINFGGSRSAKSAILTHLENLNFDFEKFLNFFRADNNQIGKGKAAEDLYRSSKLSKIDFT